MSENTTGGNPIKCGKNICKFTFSVNVKSFSQQS